MVNVKIGETEKRLLDASSAALKNAYTLWGFKVGAAVLAADGRVYEGCNVESWVSGLGTCAERCAINHAVLHGNSRITEVAVVMDSLSETEPTPCGACLQYISDFAVNSRIKIVMAKVANGRVQLETVKTRTLEDFLPCAYRKRGNPR